MPFKPKAKKLQSGSIIVSPKSLEKYKKFTNSKKFQCHSSRHRQFASHKVQKRIVRSSLSIVPMLPNM